MSLLLNRFNLMFLICQTIGVTNINNIPTIATASGAAGCIIAFFMVYILLGIPLLYMELIIGQFTGRDCVEVWKIRPCLSYTGYILILWQVIILMYNHVFLSFTVHYFLISFENPIPYYVCGPWSKKDCNMLINNFSVNEECVKQEHPARYCDVLHTTFPEYQYWRHYLMGLGPYTTYNLNIAWRVCLASGIVCIFVFLSCFKRKRSMKWVVTCLPIYSILGFLPFIMGSMLQKGLVSGFEAALDLDFRNFVKKFRLSNIIQQVVYSLGIGSGFSLNFGSTSSFRFNCFSNGVKAVLISAVFTVLIICAIVMMTCPYTYQYKLPPGTLITSHMSLVFEKVPRLLYVYEKQLLWIILIYSCYVTTGLCSHALVLYNLLETVYARFQKTSDYPGLTCIILLIFLYLITIPLLSNIGIICALAFRRYITLVSTFIAMIETVVFVICYGTHRFSEDVHFMLGIQPSFYMKMTWLSSAGFLAYAFCGEIVYYYKSYSNKTITIDIIGGYMLMLLCSLIVTSVIGKLLVAAWRKRFIYTISANPRWGPKSELLHRSRGMFSAQAMTKEYMYRQYHLKAGIIARQRNSNKRNLNEEREQPFSL